MENNKSKFWLALKYLRGRGANLIDRSHWLTVAGITLGVMALICVSSVMNGFRADIRDRIVGTLSEIRISGRDGEPLAEHASIIQQLQDQGFIASPLIRNELVLRKGSAIFSTLSFGIDPALHSQTSAALQPRKGFGGSDAQGLLAGNVSGPEFAAGGIALGVGLAARLNVMPGDQVQLLSPLFDIPTPFGLLPKVRTLKVVAVFSAGMPEYDETFSYIPLDTARFFSGYGEEVDYIEVRTPNFNRTASYAKQLRSSLPGYQIEDWSAYDSSLYGAIRFEKYMMFVIMLFMYVIASFNLTGNMLKSIAQKKRELGLLKAFGYHGNDLRDLFLYQSLILSTLGIFLGILLATALLGIQKHFGVFTLDMGEASPIPLPVSIAATDYLMVVLVSYCITLLSVILPLRRLKRINAIELIRQTT
ncbi:MAG: ABC transporter permease [Candidatus Syntrophosphaera sp.]|nr:ABC transporter permease [Candidatus Syntrophosphaera sp.]